MVQSRPLRVVLLFVITLFCCAVVGYGLAWYRVHRSKQFVDQLRQLHVGQTTEQEVAEFANRFGGTYSPPQAATQNSSAQPSSYFSAITSPYLTFGDSPYTLPGL